MKVKPRIPETLYKSRVILHSQKRAKERYDIYLITDVYSINRVIRSELEAKNPNPNTLLLLYRENKKSNRFHYLVYWRNNYYWVVWNDTLKTIHTFMPTDGLQTRISRFTNSVAAFLSCRGLIDMQQYRRMKILNISKKKPSALVHSDLGKHHHLDHNQ